MAEATADMGDIGFGYRPRAPYVCDPGQTRGRFHTETESRTRTAFQRDRDRIIHSTAFRRLKHKTQVFVAHEGDHYRTRLTHTIEVAQIARALARALRADEDLAEAIALVHDFGHPPFGHAGERALDEIMKPWGGFDHNAQSLRVVTKLERRYAEFDGLNLSWETLEGLVKHNGPLLDVTGRSLKEYVPQSILNFDRLFPLELSSHASLEAQAAAIADDIAYNTHDIDDGLRAGLLTLELLEEASFPSTILSDVRTLYPGLDDVRTAHELMRRQITAMVEDVIAESQRRLGEARPSSPDDIRRAGNAMVAFSPAMSRDEQELKAFLSTHLYKCDQVMSVMRDAEQIVRELFGVYLSNPREMPEGWREGLDRATEAVKARHASDFLAGMTDTYALKEHRRLFDHTPDLG